MHYLFSALVHIRPSDPISSQVSNLLPLHIQVGDVTKRGFYWTKCWEAKLVAHQIFFKNLKICMDKEENAKKIQKTLAQSQYLGLK